MNYTDQVFSTDKSFSATFETPRHGKMRDYVGGAALLLALLIVGHVRAASAADAAGSSNVSEERPVIGIEHEGPIRVVYQVSKDEMKNGIGKGLFYLKKLHNSYLAAGIDPDQLDLRAVYHGSAAEHLLTDAAWNRVRKDTAGNPNTAILSELARHGVHIELCNTRRISNGWEKSDIHPDVLLVQGAYQRIIDLQLRGYAYIRF